MNAPNPQTTAAAPAAQEPGWLAAFRSLLAWLFGARPEPFDPAQLRLPQYDLVTLLEKLSIEKRGAENGKHELPPSAAVTFDGPQNEIVQTIKSEVLLAQSKLISFLAGLTNRIHQTDVVPLYNDAIQVPSRLSSDLDTLWSKQADRLGPPRQRYAAVRAEYDHFREQHGLRWEPNYPGSHLPHMAVLVCLLAVETWLNSVYFAKGSEFGLIGGLTQAGGVAVINVLFSFFLGRWSSWVRTGRKAFRAVGMLSLVGFALWAPGYNFVVAHVRDEFVTNPGGDIASAFTAFEADPFAFHDPTSWFLLLLGGLFCFIAFADGWMWDDHNPGYRKLHQRLLGAREEYIHAKQSMLCEALALRDRALLRLEYLSDRVKYLAATLTEAVHQKKTLVIQAKTFFEASDGACNALLGRYRDINQRFRKTPPPAHFEEPYTYKVPEELRPDLRPDEERLDEQRRMAKRMEDGRDQTRREVESAALAFQRRMLAIADPDGETAMQASEVREPSRG